MLYYLDSPSPRKLSQVEAFMSSHAHLLSLLILTFDNSYLTQPQYIIAMIKQIVLKVIPCQQHDHAKRTRLPLALLATDTFLPTQLNFDECDTPCELLSFHLYKGTTISKRYNFLLALEAFAFIKFFLLFSTCLTVSPTFNPKLT